MRVERLAFPTMEFPCFGFPVCSENGKLYLPEYGEDDTVCRFEEMVFETMCLQEYTGEYEIKKGDERTHVYLLKVGKVNEFIVGKLKDIRPRLNQGLSEIENAPFSRLELAEFLKSDKKTLMAIHKECYGFLKEIDEGQARQWKLDNGDIFLTESERAKLKCKYPEIPEGDHHGIEEKSLNMRINDLAPLAGLRLAG